ncbi:MAG: AAA family ATPase [Deltaproteobacteria bacterium]|nr:AAA family ATPase [Deltaproteobacteria bacterium]
MLEIRCSSCANENPAAANFCSSCGMRLAEHCPLCNVQVSADSRQCNNCGAEMSGRTDRGSRNLRSSDGERRHLTILFSDIVGSTSLAGSLDPEDWQELVSSYQQSAVSAITGLGGHVAQYLGDGLVIFFGYPIAQENAAESAVRAGLAILEAIASLNQLPAFQGRELHVRVGIHSGSVVVGQGDDGELQAFGEVPNIASRIQSLAGSDVVLISGATFRLVSGLFVTEEVGARELKGVAEPVELFRVMRASGLRTRLHAAAATHGLTPFVGRMTEADELWAHWLAIHQAEPHLVLVRGEAGIGKSRLLQHFRQRLITSRHLWIECGASPFFQTNPFYSVVEMIRQALGWRDHPSQDDFLQVEHLLSLAGISDSAAVLAIARLLGVCMPPHYPQPVITPEQERYRQMEAVSGLIAALARQQPLIIVVEDLHWADASTLELLELLSDKAAVPLLLLCTARSEFREPWTTSPQRVPLTLNALSAAEVREIIGSLCDEIAIADRVMNAVAERAGGIPLFVEELTRAVLEGQGADRLIPATLRDSLMARLDRLGNAKELAQLGAALGHEFSYELINAVSRWPEPELRSLLSTLVDAGLLYEQGTMPAVLYCFKHALLRDLAHEALLRSQRREIHCEIVRVLHERFSALIEAQPALLAHHYGEAEDSERAARAWQQAGKKAAERGALLEAEQDYCNALDLLAKLPETAAREQLELVLQLELGQVSITTRGYQDARTAAAYNRARELAERQSDTKRMVQMLCGLFVVPLLRGEMQATRALGDQVLGAANRDGSSVRLMSGHHLKGVASYHSGELCDAYQWFTQACRLYRMDDHRGNPQDPGSESLEYAALAAWQLGMADTARRHIADALALANRTGKPYAIAHSRFYAGLLHALLREPDSTREFAQAVVELTHERHFPHFFTAGKLLLGWALAMQDRAGEGVIHAREGLSDYARSGNRLAIGVFMALLAETEAHAGELDQALKTIKEGLKASASQPVDLPHLLWLQGELLLQRLGPFWKHELGSSVAADSAEQSFRGALDAAVRIGAKSYALRAATSLARMLRSEARYPEALASLSELYRSFTEGFDTQEALDARALVD